MPYVPPFPLPKLPPGLDWRHEMSSENAVWVRDSSVRDLRSGGVCRATLRSDGRSYVRIKSPTWRTLGGEAAPVSFDTMEDAVNAMVLMLWLGEIKWKE